LEARGLASRGGWRSYLRQLLLSALDDSEAENIRFGFPTPV